jgi:hypothetical protein
MTIESIITLVATVLAVILAPALYVGRSIMQRLDRLEADMKSKMTDAEVRQVISDKIDPINDKCDKIDDTVNKILDHIIRQKK